MIVRIRYFNVLADYAGTKRAQIQVPAGTTILGLLKHLAETNSESFRRAVVRGDAINSYVRIFRNEKLVTADQFEQPVTDGDEFFLYPAVAGGE